MFVNILTVDDKSSLLNRDNLRQLTQMQLSLKQKTFSQFVSAFLKSGFSFEFKKKKITLIADVFPKLLTPKNVVK